MKPAVYNTALACGVLLVSIGAGMVYVPAGLITAGVLVLSFTVAGARLAGLRP